MTRPPAVAEPVDAGRLGDRPRLRPETHRATRGSRHPASLSACTDRILLFRIQRHRVSRDPHGTAAGITARRRWHGRSSGEADRSPSPDLLLGQRLAGRAARHGAVGDVELAAVARAVDRAVLDVLDLAALVGADGGEALNSPAVGWVTTTFSLLKTLPPPSGMSPVVAKPFAAASPAPASLGRVRGRRCRGTVIPTARGRVAVARARGQHRGQPGASSAQHHRPTRRIVMVTLPGSSSFSTANTPSTVQPAARLVRVTMKNYAFGRCLRQ